MRCDKKQLLLYAVTDRAWLGEETLCGQVEKVLKGGATFLQLREKELDHELFLEEAIEIKRLCKQYQVPFVINDAVEIALAMDADGVHVGQSDMEAGNVRRLIGADKILGVSVQTVEQALMAERCGADYLGVGAVFPTGSKSDADEVSHTALKAICSAVNIPVVAIGGINKENVKRLAGTGICGAAVISALFAQPDIRQATAELKKITQDMVQEKVYQAGVEQGMRTALTIAGSDSSGGAGIQADIKTMTAHRVYAMSAITALTAQNTLGVTGIAEVTPEFLRAQLEAIFDDIFPDAVKIGMVASGGLIKTITEVLKKYKAKNVVVDPVMVATSGSRLISEEAVDILKEYLLPMADLLTPNIPEAEVLSGIPVKTQQDMIEAAKKISETYRCAVLCKGGHQLNDANDLLYRNGSIQWFYGKRIDNPNTHGTGCTLSSAIASNLARGDDLDEAVNKAKRYISGALAAGLDLGKGSGPMNHAFAIEGEY